MKKPCIFCKKNGGTIFKNENNTLSAFCGSDTPCNKTLTIQKHNYADIRKVCENTTDELKTIKKEIVRSKLNFLFNYVDEGNTVNSFNELRDKFNTLSELFLDLRNKYSGMENVQDEKLRDELEGTLRGNIKMLQERVKEYPNSNDEQYVKEMIEIYFKIIENAEKIRELKYQQSITESVTSDNSKVTGKKLVQEPRTLASYFIEISS